VESLLERYCAAATGFAFMAVWAGLGLSTAVFCLLACVACYQGAAIVQRRARGAAFGRFRPRRPISPESNGDRGRPALGRERRARTRPRNDGRRAPRERARPIPEPAVADIDLDLAAPVRASRQTRYGW